MTAMDELRRLLSERGVEWAVPDESWNQDSITYWKVGSIKWVAFESENGTLWLNCNSVTDLTPEQAVDATVGDDTPVYICKKCGVAYELDYFDKEFGKPNYCPHCGYRRLYV